MEKQSYQYQKWNFSEEHICESGGTLRILSVITHYWNLELNLNSWSLKK